ncbi:hypothetical protein A8135_07295 [Legionella jamestowniensis]|uniref:Uncharacterized protein n=1 Tax=Legionella jamestowniensis TaxID=455 RepID=A0ABX2XYH0_9GAMM|nr:hypothetical protein [Legionella jamestowniensis]OCH99478.1 hypothetical protein A8135_07295 [Legionella jamestowniensis]
MSNLALHLQLANHAKDYACSQIVHGCSQIENNELPVEYFEALNNAVLKQLRALINQTRTDPYNLLADDIYDYEKTILFSSKYSLGNCYELAFQAMDYFVTTNQVALTNLEVLSIDGEKGDHIFLVVGRDPNSNINDITSWGPEAVICDPWSKQVYPASDYQEKLKTFYRRYNKDGTKTNCIMDYDPTVHTLNVILNNHQLKSSLSKSALKENYASELNLIEWALNNHRSKLEARNEHLIKKYGQEDEKHKILEQKLMNVNNVLNMLHSLRAAIPDTKEESDFRKFHSVLRKNLHQIFENIQEIVNLAPEERKALSVYRHPHNIMSRIRTFANVSPPTEKTIKEANETLVKNLSDKKI